MSDKRSEVELNMTKYGCGTEMCITSYINVGGKEILSLKIHIWTDCEMAWKEFVKLSSRELQCQVQASNWFHFALLATCIEEINCNMGNEWDVDELNLRYKLKR